MGHGMRRFYNVFTTAGNNLAPDETNTRLPMRSSNDAFLAGFSAGLLATFNSLFPIFPASSERGRPDHSFAAISTLSLELEQAFGILSLSIGYFGNHGPRNGFQWIGECVL